MEILFVSLPNTLLMLVYGDDYAVWQFVCDLKKNAEHLSCVRVLVVGHGGAGKTTLCEKALMNRQVAPSGIFYLSLFSIYFFIFYFFAVFSEMNLSLLPIFFFSNIFTHIKITSHLIITISDLDKWSPDHVEFWLTQRNVDERIRIILKQNGVGGSAFSNLSH